MARATRSTIVSTARDTWARSRVETLGCASTSRRWSWPRRTAIVETREGDVGLGRRVERAFGEDHEEVGLEARPVHVAQHRDRGRARRAPARPRRSRPRPPPPARGRLPSSSATGTGPSGPSLPFPGAPPARRPRCAPRPRACRGSCSGTRAGRPSARPPPSRRAQPRPGAATRARPSRTGSAWARRARRAGRTAPRRAGACSTAARAGRPGCRRGRGWAAPRPGVHAQVAQQVLLHEQERAEQERAEAQGEDDHAASGWRGDRGWRGPAARGRGGGSGRSAAGTRSG